MREVQAAAGVELEVACAHLAEGKGVVEGGYGHIAAVEDAEGGGVWVEGGTGIVRARRGLAGGAGAEGAGAEAGTWGAMWSASEDGAVA